MKKYLLLILMVLVMPLSVGCNSWGKVAPKGTVRNAIVEADVKKNLIGDGLTGLGVEVYEDGTAYLDGQVVSRSDRRKARNDALKVWGVKRVVNNITVK
jgi:osmotically-inducible protein OsmY